MKTKKITALLCALAVAVSVSLNASAAANTDWPQFLGADQTGVTAAPTPANAAEAELKWTANYTTTTEYNGVSYVNNACGTPILQGNNLYVTDANGFLFKLDAKTGKMLQKASCSGTISYNSFLCYGDGKIFVPLTSGDNIKIQVFSADNLSLLNSVDFSLSGKQLCNNSPITYFNGNVYFSFGSTKKDGGALVCMNASDYSIKWKNTDTTSGYYWNGSMVVGTAIAAVDAQGDIRTFNLETGALVNTYSLGKKVSSTPAYADGVLYLSTTDGYIASVKIKSDGTIDSGSKKATSQPLGENITSSPVVYNGRVYVAGSGLNPSTYASYTTPFSVLNASDLSVIYQIKDIHSQSTPLISTAYATEANHRKVLIYVADYGAWDADYQPVAGSSRVYAIKDSAGQTAASYETLFTPSAKLSQSSTQTLIPSKDGVLYYYNDTGTLFALGQKAGQPAESASSTPVPASSAKPSSTPASAAGTVSSSASSAPNSPKTGEAPAAAAAVLFACSGAVLLFLRKKLK